MKRAVVYGAGKIGRAFVGRKLVDSGYDVCFMDYVQPLVDALNARGGYTVRVASEAGDRDIAVVGIHALNSLTEAAVEAIAGCDVMATAVGANSLPEIAPVIAKGAALRMARGGGCLNVLLCENQMAADELMHRHVYAALTPAQQAWADGHLGLVAACIGCTVPVPTPEMKAEDPLLLCMDPYRDLPVDKTDIKGECPEIDGLIPFEPFEFYIKRKLFIHNGGHALCAYMGWPRGYETVADAMEDDEIARAVAAHMRACAAALIARFGEGVRQDVEANVADLLRRFRSRALHDTLDRVGADPVRKLRRSDRLVGAALFALENGVDPAPTLAGIAAALRFDAPGDVSAGRLRAMLRDQGLDAVLEQVMGLEAGEPLYAMVRQACMKDVGEAAV